MLYIDTASYTGCGGHEINEDSFCCAADFFAVADGLGGHINGEAASRCAIGYLKKNAHGDYSEDTVKNLLEGANSAVFREASGAKTTIAVLFAENGVFRYANVGDSRVYIFRNDRLLAMTKDHSVCRAAVDMGTMTFDEIRRSEDRSKLLKVLGNDDKLNAPKAYPTIQMQEGDAFLICSDGFWDYVLESEMEADLLKSDTPQKWLNYMLKRHIAAAMNKGDNYTAICGMVRSEQAPPAASPKKLLPAVLIAVLIIAAAIAAIALNNASQPNDPNGDITVSVSESVSDTETSDMTEESSDISNNSEITEESTDISDNSEVTEESTDISDSSEVTEEITDISDNSEATEEITDISDNSVVTEESTVIYDSSEGIEESTVISDNSEVTEESTVISDNSVVTEESTVIYDSSVVTEESTVPSNNISDFVFPSVSIL